MVPGRLVERAFLGETWDYVVSPADSALRLKVAALPFEVFDVGDPVWLAFDPQQMAPVAESDRFTRPGVRGTAVRPAP